MDQQDIIANVVIGDGENTQAGAGISFLAKIAVVLGLALTATVICVGIKQPVLGSSYGFQFHAEGSLSSALAVPPAGFTFKSFGYRIVLPEYAPGYVHFLFEIGLLFFFYIVLHIAMQNNGRLPYHHICKILNDLKRKKKRI